MLHPIKHFLTISKHRNTVICHCFKAGIPLRGLLHDLSKYSPNEFFAGVKYYQGYRSPNEIQRELFGYSSAWLHHKGRNRHHFEYWNDVNPLTKRYEPVKMPVKYLKEMFCDRVAASKIYQGKNYTDSHPLDYFKRGRAADYMHKDTAETLEKWLIMLKEEGEKATFEHIKNLKDY
ncbi:MAG: catalase [Ruminococcaceae bacterium]|nr:catalase [Oscillospiraceae bacterium]